MKGNRRQTKIPKIQIEANEQEAKIQNLVTDEITGQSKVAQMKAHVALKYFSHDWQCFSSWNKKELRSFSSFIKHVQNHTWEQIYKTGNRTPKHGLGYTKYEIKDIRPKAMKTQLESVRKCVSQDINFFELRVDQGKLRVHGFQSQSVFFLVALDKDHEAFPVK